MKQSGIVKRHWRDILSVLIIGIMTLLLVESTQAGFFQTDQQTDPNVFKYVARVIDDGGMPYRDTFDHKGPLIYLLNYLSILINYNHGIWLIQICLISTTIFLIFLTCRKVLARSPFFSLGISLLCLSLFLSFPEETFNIPETFVIPLIAVSGYIFLDFFLNNKVSNIRLLVCGILLGLAIMIKPNYAAIWIVFAGGATLQYFKQKNLPTLFRAVLIFSAGCLLTILPFIIWIVTNSAWNDFIDQYIKFNLLYAADEQWANAAVKANAGAFLLNNLFVFLAVIFSIFALTQKLSFKKSERFSLIVYLAAILTTAIITAASGQSYNHYGYTFIPLIFFPYSLVISKLLTEKQTFTIFLAGAYLFYAMVFAPWITTFSKAVYNIDNRHKNHDSNEITDIVKIINDKTTEDDKITVVGTWDYIYNRTNRLSASKYSYQYPIARISPSIAEAYFSELETALPKIIVSHCYDNTCEKSSLPDNLASFIKEHDYELIYSGEYGAKVYYHE